MNEGSHRIAMALEEGGERLVVAGVPAAEEGEGGGLGCAHDEYQVYPSRANC